MGVPDGAKIWEEIEARWEELLVPENEERLFDHLARKLDNSRN